MRIDDYEPTVVDEQEAEELAEEYEDSGEEDLSISLELLSRTSKLLQKLMEKPNNLSAIEEIAVEAVLGDVDEFLDTFDFSE